LPGGSGEWTQYIQIYAAAQSERQLRSVSGGSTHVPYQIYSKAQFRRLTAKIGVAKVVVAESATSNAKVSSPDFPKTPTYNDGL